MGNLIHDTYLWHEEIFFECLPLSKNAYPHKNLALIGEKNNCDIESLKSCYENRYEIKEDLLVMIRIGAFLYASLRW